MPVARNAAYSAAASRTFAGTNAGSARNVQAWTSSPAAWASTTRDDGSSRLPAASLGMMRSLSTPIAVA
jgi:hypothetical protein